MEYSLYSIEKVLEVELSSIGTGSTLKSRAFNPICGLNSLQRFKYVRPAEHS
jgi:hypothetical protein